MAKKADRNVGRYQTGEKPSRFKRIANYLGEVRTELKRVNWPTSSTLYAFTVVTIVTIGFFTFLFLEWTLVLKIL